MPSFGEKLKLEREKRKITLEQISVSTKIGTRMLRALEEDNFNQLPGGIFNKGFVRAYSRVLGLDEEKTVADYLEASGDAAAMSGDATSGPTTNSNRSNDHRSHDDGGREGGSAAHASDAQENILRLEADAERPGHQLPWGIFAALLLVVALALSLWSRYERGRASRAAGPVPTTSAPNLPASQVASPLSGDASNGAGSGLHRSGSAGAGSPVISRVDQHSEGAASGGSSAGANSAASGESSAVFSVLIEAREESWITITSDGKVISSELMTAGSERTIHGREQVVVKAGNAGGLEFQFNGKKLGALGQYGEVKTVTFGPRGIIKE